MQVSGSFKSGKYKESVSEINFHPRGFFRRMPGFHCKELSLRRITAILWHSLH